MPNYIRPPTLTLTDDDIYAHPSYIYFLYKTYIKFRQQRKIWIRFLFGLYLMTFFVPCISNCFKLLQDVMKLGEIKGDLAFRVPANTKMN